MIVKLCFLVNVRKAIGRRVEGGSRIGSIEVFAGSVWGLPIRTGRTGVPKAGDDEGRESETAESFRVAGAIGLPAGGLPFISPAGTDLTIGGKNKRRADSPFAEQKAMMARARGVISIESRLGDA